MIGSQDELGYEDALEMHKLQVAALRYSQTKNHIIAAITDVGSMADREIATKMTTTMEQHGKDFPEIILALANYLHDLASQRR